MLVSVLLLSVVVLAVALFIYAYTTMPPPGRR